jgi:V-type H+-transporting ATPase subunit a
MLSIFGYLSFLIIFKWLYPWRVPDDDPPSLLNTLIYMFLGLGGVKEGTELFGGQAVV